MADVICCRLWACYMLRPVGRVYVGILQTQAWREEPLCRQPTCISQKSVYVCGGGSPHTGHHPCLSRTKSEGVSYQCYMLSIGCSITPQRACAAEDGTRRLKRRVLYTFEEVSPPGVSFPCPWWQVFLSFSLNCIWKSKKPSNPVVWRGGAFVLNKTGI